MNIRSKAGRGHSVLTMLSALALVAGIEGRAATQQEAGLRQRAEALLPRITAANPLGTVLFRENFLDPSLARWQFDPGWKVVRTTNEESAAQVQAGDNYVNLILKRSIPVQPGHPIALFYETRFVSGTSPLYTRIDFFDANGKSGKPYARQMSSKEGAKWTRNVWLISDWFPGYTRGIVVRFHQDRRSGTTSQLRRVRVIDLASAVGEGLAADIRRWKDAVTGLGETAGALPDTPVGAQWRPVLQAQARRLVAEFRRIDSGNAATLERWHALQPLGATALRLGAVARGLRDGRVTTQRLAVFQTRAITATMILPDTAELPDARLGSISIRACPGEFESASMVLWAPESVSGVLPRIGELRARQGTAIPASAVDIRWVKCWFQAGSAPSGIRQDTTRKVLVAELLLHDDALVRVDLTKQRNRLKLSFPDGPKYASIDTPKPPTPEWGFAYSLKDFPVRDASVLLPATVPAFQNKQVWITVHVPANARPGRYTGAIELTAGREKLGTIPLSLEVLPFSLPRPATQYDPNAEYTGSLYYWGILDPAGHGGIGYRNKSEQQFRAELQAMYDHNIVAPAMILPSSVVYGNEKAFRRHLEIMREIGMAGRPLYTADSGLVGAPTKPDKLEALKQRIGNALRIARDCGFTGVYFYGIDEATGKKLLAQRPAWQAVHEAGGKIIVSGYVGHLQAVGDLLDLFNRSGDPGSEDVAAWHRYGHRVWNYGFPQTPVEIPETYRRHYGLYDWRHNLDGVCTYCFMDSSGTQWNDFDGKTYRDHCLAYPTVNGVVGTLAFEGLREGLDDVRYATELMRRIRRAEKTGTAKIKKRAADSRHWLEALDSRSADLAAFRHDAIEKILALPPVP